MKLLLIGAGNMGQAMLEGLSSYDIDVVVRDESKKRALKERFKSVNFVTQSPCIDGYVVILAIKPSSLDELNLQGEARGLISVLAGVSLERLREKIKAQAYVRAMPNMAAMKQKSVTSLCGDESLKDEACELMQSIGESFWLQSEDELNIAMALAGCAPAWLALVAEALSDGAVNLGLKRELSYKMIQGLFEGFGASLDGLHPAELKDKVTSPKGTTIAGYKALEKNAVRSAFMEAMEEAYKRT